MEPTSQSSSIPLVEYRCTCGKLLFKGMLVNCIIEIKCKSCRTVVRTSVGER